MITGYCMACVHVREYQFKGIKIYYRQVSHITGPRQWWQFTIVLAVKSSPNFWHMLEAKSILGREVIRERGQKDLYCQPGWNSAGPGEQSQRQSWIFNQEQHLLQDNYHAGSKSCRTHVISELFQITYPVLLVTTSQYSVSNTTNICSWWQCNRLLYRKVLLCCVNGERKRRMHLHQRFSWVCRGERKREISPDFISHSLMWWQHTANKLSPWTQQLSCSKNTLSSC